jgi:hypothetical protein
MTTFSGSAADMLKAMNAAVPEQQPLSSVEASQAAKAKMDAEAAPCTDEDCTEDHSHSHSHGGEPCTADHGRGDRHAAEEADAALAARAAAAGSEILGKLQESVGQTTSDPMDGQTTSDPMDIVRRAAAAMAVKGSPPLPVSVLSGFLGAGETRRPRRPSERC